MIYLYLPIDVNTKSADYVIPNVEHHAIPLAELVSNIQPQEADDDHQYGFRRRNDNSAEESLMKDYHKNWIDVMSFSHNVSSDHGFNIKNKREVSHHVGELTVTKFTDSKSPLLSNICLSGEMFPHVILRSIEGLKNGKLKLLEWEIGYARISNVSISGGSGGKPVETLSIKCGTITQKTCAIDVPTGDLDKQFGSWNTATKTGNRTRLDSTAKSLLEMAKESVLKDQDLLAQNSTVLQQMDLINQFEALEKPNKQITVLITAESGKQLRKTYYVQLKELTLEELFRVSAAKLGLSNVKDIEGVYLINSGYLIAIEKEEQVSELFDDTILFIQTANH